MNAVLVGKFESLWPEQGKNDPEPQGYYRCETLSEIPGHQGSELHTLGYSAPSSSSQTPCGWMLLPPQILHVCTSAPFLPWPLPGNVGVCEQPGQWKQPRHWCVLPPASPVKDRSGLTGSSSNKMLNYLCKLFCQTPDSELKSVGAPESSLQEWTSFIVENDSYIFVHTFFNGFREWNRDIWCLHLLLSERPPVCPGDDQGARANRVQTEALCIWSGCLARSLCVVHQWRTYREEVSEPWLLGPAVSVVEHHIHFTVMSAAWCQWNRKNPQDVLMGFFLCSWLKKDNSGIPQCVASLCSWGRCHCGDATYVQVVFFALCVIYRHRIT